MLTYAHIGDLHVTTEKQQNFKDLLSIAAQIEIECGAALDFVYLPGDNADNGLPSQYRLVRTALRLLSIPVHVITGDHDMEQGGLEAFYAHLGVDRLPKALTVGDVRCLFLDISGPGGGGPDFRMGGDQLAWLETELTSTPPDRKTVLFTHTYPADLKGDTETERLNRLLASHSVVLVDMGHTHYNELANDGRTIFAATRSTGQIEEGPVGYSLAAVDDGVVSWRFKTLDEPFPFVMITAPADHRLIIDRADRAQVVGEEVTIRAAIFGSRDVARCECQVDDEGAWVPMARAEDGRVWTAAVRLGRTGKIPLTVRAFDVSGRPGQDRVVVATEGFEARAATGDGSDADAIGAWAAKGIPGTQLGPNRNAPGGS